jgi:hypothetical protein
MDDNITWDYLTKRATVTHILLVMRVVIRLGGRRNGHHSQTVGCGMGCGEIVGEKNEHCHSLAVGHGMRRDGTTWQKKKLTS